MKQYVVTGMSCAACQNRVEKAVSEVEGVDSCAVSLLTNSMGVEGNADPKKIIEAVEKAGYGASLKGNAQVVDKEDALIDRETPRLKRRLILSLGFLCILMYITMGHNMWSWPLPSYFHHNHLALTLVQMLLALVVMIINKDFFISGFKSLYHRSPNMDTLVAMGSSVSFLWSLYVFFKMCGLITNGVSNMDLMDLYHNELYFESAAMIPALITLGKMLEALSKGRTTDALKALMKLSPKTATLLKDGNEVEVNIEDVLVGDVFVVRPGEVIPTDGIILKGETSVNEAALTGESLPVDKKEGDMVSAATINEMGYIECRSTRVGEDTTISKIIQMVSDAAATKAPIAKVADKVSGIFVPFVLVLSLIVVIGWLLAQKELSFALARGIAVLVISCPCALGLATPVAIMVGNGKGATNGILFKTSEALEEAGKADIVILDKTGTLTSGKPTITDIIPNKISENDLLTYAYSLEKYSEHPLAKAIVSKVESENITSFEVDEFKVEAGLGLRGLLGNEEIYGGNETYINSFIRLDDEYIDISKKLADEGKTPLFFGKEKELLGIIAVADVLKEDSKEAINDLHEMGIKTVMLTGDNERTAKAIGREVNVDAVVAGVMPDGKNDIVKKLKEYSKVVMVGDGINDAPALTSADLGIAIGAGTDVAIESADVVLVNSTIKDVVKAIRLSRATLRNIHENLFWAFFYNLICIPLAAGLLKYELNPMIAAAAMNLSSFTVCMNALRLNTINLDKGYTQKKVKDIDLETILKKKEEGNYMEKTYLVEGMMCEHCENSVKKALEKIEGVIEAEASHEKGEVVVKSNMEIEEDLVKEVIEDKDYTYVGVK